MGAVPTPILPKPISFAAVGRMVDTMISEVPAPDGPLQQVPQRLAHPGMHQQQGGGQKGKPPPQGTQQQQTIGAGITDVLHSIQPSLPWPTLMLRGMFFAGGNIVSTCATGASPDSTLRAFSAHVLAHALSLEVIGCPIGGLSVALMPKISG